MRAFIVLCAVAGCAVDPCAGVGGACVALEVEGGARADSLVLHVDGAGGRKDVAINGGKPLALPVAIGVAFSSSAALPADARLVVTAVYNGTTMTGATTAHVSAGRHVAARITLAAPAAADLDMGAATGHDGGAASDGGIAGDAGDGGPRRDGGPGDAGACHPQTLDATWIPAQIEVLILQQTSGAMGITPPTYDMGATILNVDTDALQRMVAQLGTTAFGLMHFPPPPEGSCFTSLPVDVAPSTNDAKQVQAALANLTSTAGTSLVAPAVNAAASYLAGRPATTKLMVLSLDGAALACNQTDDTASAIAAIDSAAKMGIKSFVFGFSGGTGPSDDANLVSFANAGQEPNTTPTESAVYPPTDAPALARAINGEIARVSCSYRLPATPDPARVSVVVGGTTIARDAQHVDGWDFAAPDQLDFYGNTCAALLQTPSTSVRAVVACP